MRPKREKLLVDRDLYCWDFSEDTRVKIHPIKKDVPAPDEDSHDTLPQAIKLWLINFNSRSVVNKITE